MSGPIEQLLTLQKSIAKATHTAAKEAVQEARKVTGKILGVEVVLKYESTGGRGTIMVYSGVYLNGERFGTEIEVHPWSIFKPMRVWYQVGDYLLEHQALEIIRLADVTDVEVTEEPYPAAEGPIRYYFTVDSLESVVALWKQLKHDKL